MIETKLKKFQCVLSLIFCNFGIRGPKNTVYYSVVTVFCFGIPLSSYFLFFFFFSSEGGDVDIFQYTTYIGMFSWFYPFLMMELFFDTYIYIYIYSKTSLSEHLYKVNTSALNTYLGPPDCFFAVNAPL